MTIVNIENESIFNSEEIIDIKSYKKNHKNEKNSDKKTIQDNSENSTYSKNDKFNLKVTDVV